MLTKDALCPLINPVLDKWSAHYMPKQGQIILNTLVLNLLGLQSYHIDHHIFSDVSDDFFSDVFDDLFSHVFDDTCLAWIIQGGRRLFPSVKTKHLPTMEDILQKITSHPATSVKECNTKTAFQLT